MTKSQRAKGTSPFGLRQQFVGQIEFVLSRAAQNWLKHLREFMSLKWLAISPSPKNKAQTKTMSKLVRAKQCGCFSPCIIYGISGLARPVYACHVRPTCWPENWLGSMKFSVCQSPNKTQVMLPVSHTDKQTKSQTGRHSVCGFSFIHFSCNLRWENETNLHFNMRYVNLEFKINRQGKRPALLPPLSTVSFPRLWGNKLLVLCALCLQRVFMLEIRAGNAPKTGNNMM